MGPHEIDSIIKSHRRQAQVAFSHDNKSQFARLLVKSPEERSWVPRRYILDSSHNRLLPP